MARVQNPSAGIGAQRMGPNRSQPIGSKRPRPNAGTAGIKSGARSEPSQRPDTPVTGALSARSLKSGYDRDVDNVLGGAASRKIVQDAVEPLEKRPER